MRRVLIIGAAVAAAAIALWLGLRTRGRGPKVEAREETPAGVAVDRAARRERPRVPAWFAQPGAANRRVAGVVTYSGAPVEGARVSLWSELVGAGAIAEPSTVTGADGRFDLGEWAAGRWFVSAEADGLAPAGVWVELHDPTGLPEPDKLELALGECDSSVHGVVEDASGGPIVGAKIMVYSSGRARGETDAQGRYDLCARPGPASVKVDAESYATAEARITAHGRVRQDFALVPATTIRGQVVRAEDDTPVAGARVIARRARDGGPTDDDRTMTRALSGDDGAFTLTGLQSGRYELRAEATDLAPTEPVYVIAALEEGEPVVLTMTTAQPLSGVVLEAGRPVAGARLTVRGQRVDGAITQPDGTFVIEHVIPGPAELVVHDYEVLEPQELLIEEGATQKVTVQVASRATIRGRVLRLGAPVAGATVQARSATPGVLGRNAASRPDGSYEIRGLEAGAWSLAADSREVGALMRGKTVTVVKGQIVEDVLLELDLAASVAGTVVDTQGAAVAGVTVRLSRGAGADPGDSGLAGTGEDGTFVVRGLAGGGEYKVTVAGPGGASTYRPPGGPFPPVAVKDGAAQVTGLRLQVERPTLTIAGKVVTVDGAVVPDASVVIFTIERDGGPGYRKAVLARTSTAADGTFTLRGLPAGQHLIRVVSGKTSLLTVADAGRADVVITLGGDWD